MYNEAGDPSVNALQDHIAALTGKEAGLWVLSGTMGNQICLRTHLTQPPHSVLLDARAHVHNWESGALPVLSQASTTQVVPKNGVHLTVDDVKKNIIADGNSAFLPFSFLSMLDARVANLSSPLPTNPRRLPRKHSQRDNPPPRTRKTNLPVRSQLPSL